MSHAWPEETVFTRHVLDVEARSCGECGSPMHICAHRKRYFFTLEAPTELVVPLVHCPARSCAQHPKTWSPAAETGIAMPYWAVGWDVLAWMGHRRFSRHWSVPQLHHELSDSYEIELTERGIENYLQRYQVMLAARQQDPHQLWEAYREVEDVILAIDGIQPEKGHETLYVVRELRLKRVWFAESLLSSAEAEVRKLIQNAKRWAEQLQKPVRGWVSDKQRAFVTGIGEEFPGKPHRYCANHFLRDVAKPVLEADSHAKVQMRRKVRGLRTVEREALSSREETRKEPPESDSAAEVVLDYCATTRGILNDDQGGPLDPPGLRMAKALDEVRDSLQRNLELHKPGPAHQWMERLAGCIDRGRALVESRLAEVRGYVQELHAVASTLDPETGACAEREQSYQVLQEHFRNQRDPLHQSMAGVMERFAPGLFAGGDDLDLPLDNLDLERWFKLPKGHERRIHGRQHVGTRIVIEGPTLMLALDAHHTHPAPFHPEELLPYRHATPPPSQIDAEHRRTVMRKARSRKKRPQLLKELEARYNDTS